MRIIAGSAKGVILKAPRWAGLRPATGRLRAALFNMLATQIQGTKVLDLFAGTGSLGLEALSRGANQVVFVENNPQCLRSLAQNIELCNFAGKAILVKDQAPVGLKRMAKKWGRFDFVFADPPYDKNLLNPTLAALLAHKIIDAHSSVIVEHSPRERPVVTGLEVRREKIFGQTVLSFLAPTTTV